MIERSSIGSYREPEEIAKAKDRADLEIKAMVERIMLVHYNDCDYSNFPNMAFSLVKDEETDRLFGAYLDKKDSGEGEVDYQISAIEIFQKEESIIDRVDWILKDFPGSPILCSDLIWQEIEQDQNTVIWAEENNNCHIIGRCGRKVGEPDDNINRLIKVLTPPNEVN